MFEKGFRIDITVQSLEYTTVYESHSFQWGAGVDLY